MEELKELRERLTEAKNRKKFLEEEKKKYTNRITSLQTDAEEYAEAADLMRTVAEILYEDIKQSFETITSTAIQTVFGKGYRFEIEFDQKKNRQEVNFYLVKGEEDERFTFDPNFTISGGIADIASFALKQAVNRIKGNRNIFIMDEPFKNIHSKRYRKLCMEFLRVVCEKMNLQIIMTTGIEEYAEEADKIFHLPMKPKRERISWKKKEKLPRVKI